MNVCKNCQKEYKAEKGNSKYCSSNCRVSYFRKNGKQGEIEQVNLRMLYNALVDKVEELTNNPIKKESIYSRNITNKKSISTPTIKEIIKDVDVPLKQVSFKKTSNEFRLRMEGEDSISYGAEKNIWKQSKNK